MDELVAMLRSMRGETSAPLVSELWAAVDEAVKNRKATMTVQVESNLVTRGLSLIVDFREKTVARIYLARKEIPGYLPFKSRDLLAALGWNADSDNYGQEFALVWKIYPSLEISQIANDLASALEALGAPQKHHWKLKAKYE